MGITSKGSLAVAGRAAPSFCPAGSSRGRGIPPEGSVFVLSGGAVRGAAQIGMLKALCEAGIKPDAIVGVSIGALNGFWFACNPQLHQVKELEKLWIEAAEEPPISGNALRRVTSILRGKASFDTGEKLRKLLEINVPVEKLLSKDYAKKLSKKISFKETIKELDILPIENHKDTVYISVVDKDRNCVSFINSIFHPFGSGIVCPSSGVLLHNRGASFNLDKKHPNFYEPNKRPMHTIIPGLVLKSKSPIIPFGVMGAHYQPVGQSHFLTNVIDYNMDVQLALDHKRSFFYDGVLSLEKTFSTNIIEKLKKVGHKIDFVDIPHGGGQAIMINPNNILVGGDPVISKTLNLRTVESEISKSLSEVQDQNKEVEIGSYPFFRAGKLGVSIVLRSTDQDKIDKCNEQILHFVKTKNIEILREV